MIKKICTTYLLFVSAIAFAQNPAPADTATKRILLLGGIAHVGNGTIIEQSAIGIAQGKITFIMDGKGFKPARNAFDTIIDVYGKHVYPGLIAMNTMLGLNEIEAVRATHDYDEVGTINPSSRAIIAYNTDSKVTPTVRSNGVMMAQIAPVGGLISGQSSVVELDAWNYEDAVYKMDEGIWMNFPSTQIIKASWADTEEEQMKRSAKQMQDLTTLFEQAKVYSKNNKPEVVNQNLEAMRGLFNQTKILYVRCNFAKDILAAIKFCELYKVRMVLCGGADAWMVTDELKSRQIPVIIERTQNLPRRDDEDLNLPYKLPSLLMKRGIDVSITDEGFWKDRNLPFQAGQAVSYGLTKEEALQTITLNPARILGIDKTVGSLEDGKDATLIISTGDILDMKTSIVTGAYIRGKEINLDDIQKQLYQKYLKKYKLD
jgi:imidazolonepropionase-like amidohydrolase